MKKLISLSICILLCFGICITSNASDTPDLSAAEATYDLEKGGEQTFILSDSDGNPVSITIKELPTRAVANNTYAVSLNSGDSWKAGYNVTVYNNKITKLSDAYTIAYSGSISQQSLKLESNTQGTLYFTWKYLFLSYNNGVRTTLTSSGLKVSVL